MARICFAHIGNAVMMVLDHSVIPAVVLVVEDEMLVRMRAVDMVEDAGFTSVEAWMPMKLSPSSSRALISRCFSPISRCRAVWMV
jgi:hypothetical protein